MILVNYKYTLIHQGVVAEKILLRTAFNDKR